MNQQDQLKQLVGRAAVDYVLAHVAPGAVLGVGTGSTANFFIDALAEHKARFRGALSSSVGSTTRLQALGFDVLDPNDVEGLQVYVDGADEIDAHGYMIKGGGGALSREKIIAAMAKEFVCIADVSKRVATLGGFPLPVEVLPMARRLVERQLQALGGKPAQRRAADGSPYVTDNGNAIIDAAGLKIDDPQALEREINSWPGVVTVGLFARRGANICLFGTANGVEQVVY